MTKPSLMIHGHFYQPPRENALTGIIPEEAGAYPYHNWNEKINVECYKPNAIAENFKRISFNIGPTLFAWLENADIATYWRIIQQENENERIHGVGNSIAQSFNHTILPLANLEDQRTQIVWGITDYQVRFGHLPQGLWLPETAVDYQTLEIAEECGIRFVILAPWQTNSSALDPTEAYTINLRDGKRISAFFYEQDLSTRLSFDPGSTTNADFFMKDIVPPHFNPEKRKKQIPQFLMIASDGEVYGHHQPFRDQFLARLVNGAADASGIEISYPALWLKEHPPEQSVTIREDTSWSCMHALSRWRGECACTPGSSWKATLRSALDTIGTLINLIYYEEAAQWIDDPWEIRNRSIWMWLGKRTFSEISSHQVREGIHRDEIERILLLLEAQRARQWMFTSCGWFFDELDRIEPKNNIAFAAQAVCLTERATGIRLVDDASNCFRDVNSSRSGLHAKDVFLQNYEQAQNIRVSLPAH